jgi:transcriptional regulator with XRE-family HTH domain
MSNLGNLIEKSFGKKVQEGRRNNGWTIRKFIEQLGIKLSPSYITKIEIHGEIPSPELICKIADVLGVDRLDLLETARANKIQSFTEFLEAKYQKAVRHRN